MTFFQEQDAEKLLNIDSEKKIKLGKYRHIGKSWL